MLKRPRAKCRPPLLVCPEHTSNCSEMIVIRANRKAIDEPNIEQKPNDTQTTVCDVTKKYYDLYVYNIFYVYFIFSYFNFIIHLLFSNNYPIKKNNYNLNNFMVFHLLCFLFFNRLTKIVKFIKWISMAWFSFHTFIYIQHLNSSSF